MDWIGIFFIGWIWFFREISGYFSKDQGWSSIVQDFVVFSEIGFGKGAIKNSGYSKDNWMTIQRWSLESLSDNSFDRLPDNVDFRIYFFDSGNNNLPLFPLPRMKTVQSISLIIKIKKPNHKGSARSEIQLISLFKCWLAGVYTQMLQIIGSQV